MAQKRDYYEILNVARDADEEEIKKALSETRNKISSR